MLFVLLSGKENAFTRHLNVAVEAYLATFHLYESKQKPNSKRPAKCNGRKINELF